MHSKTGFQAHFAGLFFDKKMILTQQVIIAANFFITASWLARDFAECMQLSTISHTEVLMFEKSASTVV